MSLLACVFRVAAPRYFLRRYQEIRSTPLDYRKMHAAAAAATAESSCNWLLFPLLELKKKKPGLVRSVSLTVAGSYEWNMKPTEVKAGICFVCVWLERRPGGTRSKYIYTKKSEKIIQTFSLRLGENDTQLKKKKIQWGEGVVGGGNERRIYPTVKWGERWGRSGGRKETSKENEETVSGALPRALLSVRNTNW